MSTEAKVGAFVIGTMLVLAVGVYLIQSTQEVKGQVSFKTYFRYAGGLAPGATVLFGGIKVGEVTSVKPSAGDPTQIEVTFNVKSGTPINRNSTAKTGTVTLMGTPALLITTGTHDAKRLKPGEAVQSEEAASLDEVTKQLAMVADSANALITDLREEIPELTARARTALDNMNDITGPYNQKRIAGILDQVNSILDRESPKIARITDQISELAGHADSVVLSAKPVFPNLDRTVTNVSDTVDQIRNSAMKDLDQLSAAIEQARATLVTAQNVVGTNAPELAETMRNLRATSENVRAMSESLKQRPWNLIRTTQPPDRKVPQ
jgi:phospholipid/cholesterol/gamma-HCH transport system substrate-binding protein